MPLVGMKKMLQQARAGGYAVGAFNPVDYLTMKAIVTAAERLNAPVIAQTSVKTVKYWGHQACAVWMAEIAQQASVPVSFHLDHCKDIEVIKGCIAAGWTDVMIDASALPYEENLAMTREVVSLASAAGLGVEAELGQIVGVEEDIVVSGEDAHLADPDKAVAFCEGLDLATFAPAIGTAHGVYQGEPQIAFDRIEEIYRRTQVPIALHGGTGLSDEVFLKCIDLGCAKVNISTQLKHCFIDSFCDYHRQKPEDYEPLRVIDAQFEACVDMVAANIKLFGGEGKGSEILEKVADHD